MRLHFVAVFGMVVMAGGARAGGGPVLASQQDKLSHGMGVSMTGAEVKAQGASFLAENSRKEGVVTLPSGLQYKVLRAGHGKVPTDADRVVCHYRGTLVDGTEFDSSYRRGRPATFDLKRLIPGWREALKLMPVGSKWQIFIPPQLAYGERGARGRRRSPGKIGPHATLLFEMELLSVRPGPGLPATTTAAAELPAVSGD